MARFDVYKYKTRGFDLIVDIQADFLEHLETRIAIPLYLKTSVALECQDRLKPIIKIKDKDYVLVTTDMATVFEKNLGDRIANLEHHRYKIMDAVDFLFQGF